MCPERIVCSQIGHFPVGARDCGGHVALQRADERLIVLLERVCTALGEITCRKARLAADGLQKTVLFQKFPAVGRADGQRAHRAQKRRVGDVFCAHAAKARHEREQRPVDRPQHNVPAPCAQIQP